ncbi:APC family permease [Mycoplasma todarodis]|uniref:APC family permease n=1 Tax=Mycoplasma todarodis TaxID=1937191 RepID=UPI001039B1BE|nr:amino acid permease [Mycoplasma todarodis]
MAKKDKTSGRYKMSMLTFLFLSIAGGGFALKGVVSQFTEFGNFTVFLYLVCIIVYAIPYLFMIFEFASMKITKNSESGYQTWMSLILGRKLGFMAGFFYFFVNLFFFLDLVPVLITYGLYTVLGDGATQFLTDANAKVWFKPVIGLISILLFWIATFISTKGPKWLGRVSSGAASMGMILTFVFIVAAIIALASNKISNTQAGNYTMWKASDSGAVAIKDISWQKIGAVSWALQSMGGLETMAAYKNDVRGGEKAFRRTLTINTIIFAGLFMLCAIFLQLVFPANEAVQQGLLASIYYAFYCVGMPVWFTHIIGLTLTVSALASLMLWTAAPVKMLFVDAPKGIFGKKCSKVLKDGTPVNGLIAQGIIVTILFTLQIVGSLSSGMNTFLIVLKNLDAGASTIPVIFIIVAFIMLRLQSKKRPELDRTYHFLGKKPIWAILAVIPLLSIVLLATFTSLIPSPEKFRSGDLKDPLMQLVLGPIGIILGFIFCEFLFRRWRKKNPNDHTFFNEIGIDEEAAKELKVATTSISEGEEKNEIVKTTEKEVVKKDSKNKK